MHAISGQSLRVGRRRLKPIGMQGWGAVVFRAEDDGGRAVISIDDLVQHLDDWENGGLT